MTMPTGRERQHDLMINGYPYQSVRSNGTPAWNIETVPEVEGQQQGAQFAEHAIRSLHSGFGWGQQLHDNTYHWGVNLDARFPMQVICGPLVTAVAQVTNNGSVTGFFERGSYLYTCSGRYVNRIDPATDTVSAAGGYPKDLGAGFAPSKPAAFDGKTYICSTSLNKEVWSFDGTTWAQDNDSKQGSYLAKFWADTYWGLAQAHLASSTPSIAWVAQGSDPFTAANWAAAYEVGDQDSAITSLESLERTIFIGKTDGLYYMDYTGRCPLIVPAVPKHANNGINMMADPAGQIWYPTQSGLYLFNPATGTIANAAPGYSLPNRSGIVGFYTALAQLRGWTYCSVYDGTDSYIMCGRERQPEEPGFGPYVWHGALVKILNAQVTSMHVSGLTTIPRLWFGLSTGNVSYIKLPTNGDNPLASSTCTFAASSSLYLPADDYGVGGMRWNLQSLVLEAEGLGATTTVQVYERRDLGSWVSLQTVSASGRTAINTSGDKRFNRCELRLDIVNGSSSSTPVIRVLMGRAARRPAMYDLITAQVYCSDASLSRMGIQSRYSGKTLWDQLETLDEYYPVTISDYWTGSKRDQVVLVQHVSGGVARQNERGNDAAEQVATVVMKVVA